MSDGPERHQHIRIARYAVQAGWIELDEALHVLLGLGQLRAEYGEIPLEGWVARGMLSEHQLDEALEAEDDDDEPLSLPLAPPLPEAPTTLHDASSAVTEEGAETLMTLPTAVIQKQRSQRRDFEREETRVRSRGLETDEMLALERQDEIHARLTFEAPMELVSRSRPEAAPGPEADTEVFDEEAPTRTFERPPMTGPRIGEGEDLFRDRYVLGDKLGQGGGGRVMRAYDRILGRRVAMKMLRTDGIGDKDLLERFIAEAQTTGQLEHPNIMPIYDFGTLRSGEVYYTMREVRNSSLREVINGLCREDPELLEEYTLLRLVNLLGQVCLAIHYAHVRGVVHRDLKPDNIMLGDYGEVLVMDWGLARLFDEQSVRREQTMSEEGQTLGTPAYMPPEQARGELEAVDERSDIYSLGALLYEILTLQPPYTGENPLDVMWQVVEGDLVPPSQRAEEREVPAELERICMRAMSHRKDTRYDSAKQMHDALTDWIEGVQPREARKRTTDGAAWFERYQMLLREGELLEERVRQEAGCVEEWEPIERKRPLWQIEDRLERNQLESARAFGHAVANYTQALAYQPGHTEARRGLADLYWVRFEQAEREQDMVNAIYFKALVAQYDDEERYTGFFSERVDLRVQIEPEGQLWLARLEERDRRMVTLEARELGPTPIQETDLATGPYLLEARFEDRPTLRYPLQLERAQSQSLELRAPPQRAHREGFVYVPDGEFVAGGDPDAFDPYQAEVRYLDGFFCAVFPVTFRAYLRWVNELEQDDPEQARRRAPQLRGSEGLLVRRDPDTGLWIPDEILIEGPARQRYPAGQGHELDIPVVGVSQADARAYIAWRAARDEVAYRLPTTDELEKAGRGPGGRLFPWGDRFDATFCKMRFSREELPQLEPVGTFTADVSPYGVRDLAGGVQEWCADPEDPPSDTDHPVKGGAWNQDERACRLASRIRILAAARTAGIGFRLVYGVPEE